MFFSVEVWQILAPPLIFKIEKEMKRYNSEIDNYQQIIMKLPKKIDGIIQDICFLILIRKQKAMILICIIATENSSREHYWHIILGLRQAGTATHRRIDN